MATLEQIAIKRETLLKSIGSKLDLDFSNVHARNNELKTNIILEMIDSKLDVTIKLVGDDNDIKHSSNKKNNRR